VYQHGERTRHGLMVHVCCMSGRSGHGTSPVWLGFVKHDFGAWGIYKRRVDTSALVIEEAFRDDCSGLKAMPTECA
jgi:hypothetical protein